MISRRSTIALFRGNNCRRRNDRRTGNAVLALPAILAKVYLKIVPLDQSNNNNLTTPNKNS